MNPESLTPGRWPYAGALAAIRWQAKQLVFPSPKIWARNSYLTPAFRPLHSDLDITVWFDEPPTEDGRLKLSKILSRSKKIFPALGECNSYLRSSTVRLSTCMNLFELSRDPKLGVLLEPVIPKPRPVPSRSERTVFLLRMLEVNYRDLLRDPRHFEAKWRQHFRTAGIDCGVSVFRGEQAIAVILNHALSWLGDEYGADFQAATAAAIEVYLHGRIMEAKKDYQIRLNEIVVCTMAHRFSFLPEAVPRTKGPLSEIALAQLAWEVAAVNSRMLLARPEDQLAKHLHNISDHLKWAGESNPRLINEFHQVGEAASQLLQDGPALI